MEAGTKDFSSTAYNHINAEAVFQKRIEVPESVDYAALWWANVIATATVMIRTRSLSYLSMPDFPRAQHYALWLNLLHQVEQAYGINEPCVDHRVTSNTGNRKKMVALKYLFDIYT